MSDSKRCEGRCAFVLATREQTEVHLFYCRNDRQWKHVAGFRQKFGIEHLVVHDRRSHAQSSGKEERMLTRKQRAEAKPGGEAEQSPKKTKVEDESKDKAENDQEGGKSIEDVKEEFEKFCKATREYLTIQQMKEILEANDQDSSGSDDAVVPRCQDILFYGPLDKCPMCSGYLEISSSTYSCKGSCSEWSSCIYTSRDPPRRDEPIKLPDSVKDSGVADLLRKHETRPPSIQLASLDKPFKGMVISLAGRLSRTHQYWKSKIEKHGGKVANHVIGVNCVVASPAERERGGSSKLAEAMERNIPIVWEAWISNSIEKKEPLPLDAYDIVSDLAVEGRGIPLYHQDASEEALETLTAELKISGKRAVHKDTKLQEQGGQILEKDGFLYNCAFSGCDRARGVNEGRIGDVLRADERVEEQDSAVIAIVEFAKNFEETTGNEFEPWEREKKIQKKLRKLYPIDMDDGVDIRHGGLGLRQLGVAMTHCKLEPKVANFMKFLCGQEIYRYAMMEIGLDFPELPLGMVTDFHLKRCEEILLESVEKLLSYKDTGPRVEALWSDFSQRIFTLMPSTRPYVMRNFNDIAEHGVAAFETVRDINVASHLIGDIAGSTLDDPLFDCYRKLGCSISSLDKDSDDYRMVAKYLEKTYEPVKVGEISFGISIDDVFAVESSALQSLDEIKKLPNKVMLWYSELEFIEASAHGILACIVLSTCPYMFGRAIVCTDAAAEAARYGFTAVDRPEGFLILAVASLGENVTELTGPPENVKSLKEKKQGVFGRGRKKTDESEHFTWKGDIKVPCGSLIPSKYKDSPLEYNEYAVYSPQQVSIKFLVAVKFEEKDVVYDTASSS